jgi:hypothetical protein
LYAEYPYDGDRYYSPLSFIFGKASANQPVIWFKSCDVVGDFARMRFEREMAGVEQMHLGVGIVAAKRFRAGGQKKCIAPACPRLPDQQSAVKDDVQIRRY